MELNQDEEMNLSTEVQNSSLHNSQQSSTIIRLTKFIKLIILITIFSFLTNISQIILNSNSSSENTIKSRESEINKYFGMITGLNNSINE